MTRPARRAYGHAVFASFPSAWLLLALPFISSTVIASVPPLKAAVDGHNRVTWPIGVIGLCFLLAALTGVVPPALGLPVAIIAGIASGFAMFWVPRTGSDGDDWRQAPPPPDEPPPGPEEPEPIDWGEFDRLRIRWGETRMPAR